MQIDTLEMQKLLHAPYKTQRMQMHEELPKLH
jgi:hypothetical protein